jgi:hypothetical protein
MRVLRQCTVPRAEVMFVIIQCENIRPQRKKLTRMLQRINCSMFAVRLWNIRLYRWPIGSLPSTCMLCIPPTHCTKDIYALQGSTRDLWTVPRALVINKSAFCIYVFRVILRIKGVTAKSMKVAMFWGIAPCTLLYTDRRFRAAYKSSELLWNLGQYLSDYMVQ